MFVPNIITSFSIFIISSIQLVNGNNNFNPSKLEGTWHVAMIEQFNGPVPEDNCIIVNISAPTQTSIVANISYLTSTMKKRTATFTGILNQLDFLVQFDGNFTSHIGTSDENSFSIEISLEDYSSEFVYWLWTVDRYIYGILLSRYTELSNEERRMSLDPDNSLTILDNKPSVVCKSVDSSRIDPPADKYGIVGIWHVIGAVDSSDILKNIKYWQIVISTSGKSFYEGVSIYTDEVTGNTMMKKFQISLRDATSFDEPSFKITATNGSFFRDYFASRIDSYLYNFSIWEVYDKADSDWCDLRLIVSSKKLLSSNEYAAINEVYSRKKLINITVDLEEEIKMGLLTLDPYDTTGRFINTSTDQSTSTLTTELPENDEEFNDDLSTTEFHSSGASRSIEFSSFYFTSFISVFYYVYFQCYCDLLSVGIEFE